MGIGNSARRPGSALICATTHYPSWGSETVRRPAAAPAAPAPHYPSWGSETDRLDRGTRGAPALITPHGDRKPAGAGRPIRCRHLAHYPSWGSETHTVQAGVLRSIALSLPLMGIGNGEAARVLLAPDILSLPLMGIGNGSEWHSKLDPKRLYDLITPHGDRKPRRTSQPRPRSSRPHYPSWGSETGRRPRDDRGRRPRSLPLMGIGNPRPAFLTSAHPDFSLPLMGIGNPRWRPRRSARQELITPHGDRKHRGGARHCRRRRLITPHGDRKHRGARPTRCRGVDSLPLMGIGNLILRPASNSRRPLITPHGDRKPARQAAATTVLIRSLPLMGIGNRAAPGGAGAAAEGSSLPLMGIGNLSIDADRH